jgi:hypothetical protein
LVWAELDVGGGLGAMVVRLCDLQYVEMLAYDFFSFSSWELGARDGGWGIGIWVLWVQA